MTTESITALLTQVNWDFPDATTSSYSVHSLHWFPGNFIAQIPSYLIQAISTPGELIFDPFCGSGTTGSEAVRLGRNCLQADVNPVSIQVSAGKLDALDTGTDLGVLDRFVKQLTWPTLVRSHVPGMNGEGTSRELCQWFTSTTLQQLRAIWQLIEQANGPGRHLLELIFYDTLFDCASTSGMKTRTGRPRRHHWGWVADNVQPRNPSDADAVELFVDRMSTASEVIQRREKIQGRTIGIFQHDARSMPLRDSCVDAVVTSPPYIGMIDYTRASRLHYLWEGWKIKTDEAREIGARYRRDRPRIIEEYLDDMQRVAREITRVLKPGRCCAMVIGASTKYPQVAHQVVMLFGQYMPLLWGPMGRDVSRRRISSRVGTTPKEFVAVFRKQ